MLDRWRLKDFAPGEGLSAKAHLGEGEGWIEVSAPGDTYLALIEAGRIPHPFKGRHETDVAWVRDREWWWRTSFDAAPASGDERVVLEFDGLDTFAEIYLDGAVIGRTDNMFRGYTFDVTEQVRSGGAHSLAICFTPPAMAVSVSDLPVWSAFTDRVSVSKRNFMRKAQFGWGWDWGPDLPTVGVWRPVRLERRGAALIKGVNFTTLALSEHRADVRVSVEIDALPVVGSTQVEITLTDPDGVRVAAQSLAAADVTSVDLVIDAPRLWWTADLGEQPLYTLKVGLIVDGAPVSEQSRRVGIRTIALDTSDDPGEPGSSFFRFVLNGSPIFAKGACWVPATSFVGDVDEGRYRDLLTAAVTANMNMIRIWGGGIYEPDLFYDLCDERGLLVWQDFMFACAHYPEDDAAFVESVRREIEDQVRRLRGHACLALWCGNNENQVLHDFNAQMTGDDVPLAGELYYDVIMPALLAELDPVTAYWPGSPSGGPSPNSMRGGDVHDWTVWHGVPFVPDKDLVGVSDSSPEGVAYTRYAEDHAKFVSEFGIQAAPVMATLKRWMAPEDLELGSPGFLGRVKDKPEKANAMMIPVTGAPTTLDDYVDFSMWTQAAGMKFGIEHFRRRNPHCAGALIWQFNDCWPCISWSLIDYDGAAKASYHAVARAFEPVLASFRSVGSDVFELWITNDRLTPVKGAAVIELTRLDGQIVWREEISFDVAANGSAWVWRGEVQSADDRMLSVRSAEALFSPNRQWFVPIARLPLTWGARPSVALQQIAADEVRVTLSASDFLAFVHLTSDQPGLSFSDNYFDMAVGEAKTIVVRAPAGLEPGAIHVRCWNERAGMGPRLV